MPLKRAAKPFDPAEMTTAELLTDFFREGPYYRGAVAEVNRGGEGNDYRAFLAIDPETAEISALKGNREAGEL